MISGEGFVTGPALGVAEACVSAFTVLGWGQVAVSRVGALHRGLLSWIFFMFPGDAVSGTAQKVSGISFSLAPLLVGWSGGFLHVRGPELPLVLLLASG